MESIMTLEELCETTDLSVIVTGDGKCYECGAELSWNEFTWVGIASGNPTCGHNYGSTAYRGDSGYNFRSRDYATRIK
jgi:hypothetical protein